VLGQWARQIRVVESETGLTAERIELLSLLEAGGPTTAGELAEEVRASRPAITRLVNGLESAGFAQRGASLFDGRSVVVKITTLGRRRLNRARANRVRAIGTRLRGRSDRELAQLEQGLRILAEMLDS
jgi:DNA-binding MarR family transcriptional regulator